MLQNHLGFVEMKTVDSYVHIQSNPHIFVQDFNSGYN